VLYVKCVGQIVRGFIAMCCKHEDNKTNYLIRRTRLMFLSGMNPATCFGFQQANIGLRIRKYKDKTLQLQ
jgi:hypothetical protein